MLLPFVKMHGCGNDYVFIDCFDRDIATPSSLAVRLSDRHTGIGADGIVLILPASSSSSDARMRMFNADGSEGAMCGNAIRCVGKYLFENNITRKTNLRIETKSGVRELWLTPENDTVTSVKVDMGRAELRPEKIPVTLDGESVISRPVVIGDAKYEITCVSMGNPHAVVFVENTDALDLRKIGAQFENSPLFPDRVNAEFAEVIGANELKMRVWERGSGETQACGTGACAAAVAAVLNGHSDKGTDIKVQLPGGELIINYTDATVYMTGDCVKVFDGVVEI